VPDLQAGIGAPPQRPASGRVMTPEPLRRCIQCGHLVYLSKRCRFIGILHAAPDYVSHEETP